MKKFAAVMVLLAVVLCGCGKRVSDNERLNNAARELRNGDIKKSVEQLEAVLKNNPDNCSARLLMALNHEKNGNFNEALDLASSVAQEYPDSFAALYTCGRLRMNPTVSVRSNFVPLGVVNWRVVGSSVAKSLSSDSTSAPVSAFKSVDLPALV